MIVEVEADWVDFVGKRCLEGGTAMVAHRELVALLGCL
jgi:hypothetical protein